MWTSLVTKTLLTGAICAGAVYGYTRWADHKESIGYARAENYYTGVIDKSNREHKEELDRQKSLVDNANTALANLRLEREANDATNTSTISALRQRVSVLSAGGLRDPFAKTCDNDRSHAPDSGASGAVPSDENRTETSGLLSAELTEFLRTKALEADEINASYDSCRADSRELRRKLGELAAQQKAAASSSMEVR